VTAEPPLGEVGRLVAHNRRLLHPAAYAAGSPGPVRITFLGRPLADLQRDARQSAVQAARAYLARRGEPVPSFPADGPLLAAGHQPELFHPGVWVKNFALFGLARQHGGTSLNLVVDNDTVKNTAVRVPVPPAGRHAYPHTVSVPFDSWPGEVPYEEYTVREPALFEGFGGRVAELMHGWGVEPLAATFWPEVLRQAEHDPHPGACIAAARRGLERRWGCHNLELPLSELCGTEPFAWFVCALLADLPHFHAVYNSCVRDYRRAHGIRSRNHPVPDLAAEGDWLEVPLWGWRPGQGRRGRLLARARGDRLELRCNAEPWPALPLPREGRTPAVLQAWQELAAHGCKVRTRALTTTLYSRLLLCDLFMHGIGGGIYDELTDAIWRRYFGTEPPGFLVLSATRWLPLPAYPVQAEDCRRLLRLARDLRYNPERFLQPGQLAGLVAEKRALLAQAPGSHRDGRRRFRKLRALTEQLHEPLAERERQARRDLCRCERQMRANALLRRRDYSFCLYPEAVLRPFCTRFLAGQASPPDRPLSGEARTLDRRELPS
jgi:hypothetical protein